MKTLRNSVVWPLELLASVSNSKASDRHIEEDGKLFLNIYIPGTPITKWNQLKEYFPNNPQFTMNASWMAFKKLILLKPSMCRTRLRWRIYWLCWRIYQYRDKTDIFGKTRSDLKYLLDSILYFGWESSSLYTCETILCSVYYIRYYSAISEN